MGVGMQGNEYGKQLYGGSAGQGIQGFMGLGQSGGPSGGAQLGQRGGGAAGSPEAAYKPYAGNVGVGVKDGGSGVGVGMGGQQGRGGQQQQAQQQQQQAGGFYGGQRFGTGVPQGQSQQAGGGPQAHLAAYPQGGSESSAFYSYGRQQQYWQ